MADYNLTGLNPREFEHLIQALALKVIASGVTPFGDGPDGAREATFNGKMSYPSDVESWNGYLVIQSKFLARPTGDSKKDGEWVLKQLKSDLSKFQAPSRNLPIPEYYLFVTNVVLTPVQDTGSKDKAYKLLDEYKGKLGFKSYDIWDYDKICRLLDGQSEIYSRYAAFITSSDVLTKIIKVLENQQPDFQQIMSLFLQAELRADQFVRLEQAGHTPDQKTALAQVFVDLPSFDHPTTEPPSEPNNTNLQPGIVSEVLAVGSQILRRSICMSSEASDNYQDQNKPESGRFVLVGGPGQGKSTVAQFLCQIYRAAILKDTPPHTIIPEAQAVLELLDQQCQACGINMPAVRRFPIRVVLDQFANELAEGTINSLLSHILRHIAITSEHECSADDIRRWLKAYPWLLILDGLDEVPPTSNRSQVLEKITDFLSQVAVLDADVLVVATTRPQGYNEEFSPRFYHHRFLAPLSQVRALHYGDRLTTARYGAEPARRVKVFKRLTQAASQDATGRLMRTPLQVTIMATLLEQIGQPPQERYRLFQQYYDVIYRREIERDIPASRILQQRKADVNAIHNRVGLLLQTESELEGNSEAQLSDERFGRLVRARMSDEGYGGVQLESLVDEIRQAALQRLVFLVGLENNRIGFEVRSLQEYTAAEALMDGGDSQVRERLVEIAASPHWRNVFLFAAGKCFAERQFLRDMIVGICDQLNDSQNDMLAGATLAGSRLALDLLDDGVANDQPNFARALARQALKLVEIPDTAANVRIASIYNIELESLFKEHLERRLGQADFGQMTGAWTVLLSLIAKQVDWAKELADAKWPTDERQQMLILTNRGPNPTDWSLNKLASVASKLKPHQIQRLSIAISTSSEIERLDKYLEVVSKSRKEGSTRIRLFPDVTNSNFHTVSFGKINLLPLASLDDLTFENPQWLPYVANVNFSNAPSAASLARELRELATNSSIQEYNLIPHHIAWPLSACLAASKTNEDLMKYADRAESGELGSLEDWLGAEARWKATGITKDDVLHMVDGHWPFDSTIREKGFPFSSGSMVLNLGIFEPLTFALTMEIYEALPESHVKRHIADFLFDYLIMGNYHDKRALNSLSPKQAVYVFSGYENRILNPRVLDSIGIPHTLDEDWIKFFEYLGNSNRGFYVGSYPIQQTSQLAQAYVSNPERIGVLSTLGYLVVSGSSAHIPYPLLEKARTLTDHLKRAALLIEAAMGDLNEAQASRIAREVCDLPKELRTISHLLITLKNQNISSRDKELLVKALREQPHGAKSLNQYFAIRSLNEFIQSRRTSMSESICWLKLGLPVLP